MAKTNHEIFMTTRGTAADLIQLVFDEQGDEVMKTIDKMREAGIKPAAIEKYVATAVLLRAIAINVAP